MSDEPIRDLVIKLHSETLLQRALLVSILRHARLPSAVHEDFLCRADDLAAQIEPKFQAGFQQCYLDLLAALDAGKN